MALEDIPSFNTSDRDKDSNSGDDSDGEKRYPKRGGKSRSETSGASVSRGWLGSVFKGGNRQEKTKDDSSESDLVGESKDSNARFGSLFEKTKGLIVSKFDIATDESDIESPSGSPKADFYRGESTDLDPYRSEVGGDQEGSDASVEPGESSKASGGDHDYGSGNLDTDDTSGGQEFYSENDATHEADLSNQIDQNDYGVRSEGGGDSDSNNAGGERRAFSTDYIPARSIGDILNRRRAVLDEGETVLGGNASHSSVVRGSGGEGATSGAENSSVPSRASGRGGHEESSVVSALSRPADMRKLATGLLAIDLLSYISSKNRDRELRDKIKKLESRKPVVEAGSLSRASSGQEVTHYDSMLSSAQRISKADQSPVVNVPFEGGFMQRRGVDNKTTRSVNNENNIADKAELRAHIKNMNVSEVGLNSVKDALLISSTESAVDIVRSLQKERDSYVNEVIRDTKKEKDNFVSEARKKDRLTGEMTSGRIPGHLGEGMYPRAEPMSVPAYVSKGDSSISKNETKQVFAAGFAGVTVGLILFAVGYAMLR